MESLDTVAFAPALGAAHGAAHGAALGAGRLSGARGCIKKACGGNAAGFGRRGRDSNSW